MLHTVADSRISPPLCVTRNSGRAGNSSLLKIALRFNPYQHRHTKDAKKQKPSTFSFLYDLVHFYSGVVCRRFSETHSILAMHWIIILRLFFHIWWALVYNFFFIYLLWKFGIQAVLNRWPRPSPKINVAKRDSSVSFALFDHLPCRSCYMNPCNC